MSPLTCSPQSAGTTDHRRCKPRAAGVGGLTRAASSSSSGGAGKSTLLRLLATAMPPTSGCIVVAGHEAKRGERPPAQYFLSGPEPGDRVELPQEMYELLLQVVSAMRQGLAVTVAPRSQTLTTQQAADLLGISRPTLVKLLDEARLPYERVNSHRRLLLRDVLDFREERRRAQYEALEAMSVDVEEEDDLDSVLESLKGARRAVAELRRRRS